jgi:hypothetical protein
MESWVDFLSLVTIIGEGLGCSIGVKSGSGLIIDISSLVSVPWDVFLGDDGSDFSLSAL